MKDTNKFHSQNVVFLSVEPNGTNNDGLCYVMSCSLNSFFFQDLNS
jgi:hypothetical protein